MIQMKDWASYQWD